MSLLDKKSKALEQLNQIAREKRELEKITRQMKHEERQLRIRQEMQQQELDAELAKQVIAALADYPELLVECFKEMNKHKERMNGMQRESEAAAEDGHDDTGSANSRALVCRSA